jgi:hypothetical protein
LEPQPDDRVYFALHHALEPAMTPATDPNDDSDRMPPKADRKDEDRNPSDRNDGVERPLGYFSSQAQADRNAVRPGSTPTNEVSGGPGFFSPEQQAARNTPPGAVSPTPLEPGEAIAPAVDANIEEQSEKRTVADYHAPD